MSGEHGEPWTNDDVVCNGESLEACHAMRERAIACVNALDGVSTADIEAGAVRELVRVAASVLSLFQLVGYGLKPLEKALKPFAEVQHD
jgi:hypothetical protein